MELGRGSFNGRTRSFVGLGGNRRMSKAKENTGEAGLGRTEVFFFSLVGSEATKLGGRTRPRVGTRRRVGFETC